MWYIWLIAAGVFFVVEIMTVGFMIFWLGVAALLACLVSLITSNLIIQTAVFVISSAVSFSNSIVSPSLEFSNASASDK